MPEKLNATGRILDVTDPEQPLGRRCQGDWLERGALADELPCAGQAASRPAEDQSALLTRIPAMIEPCWKPEALPSDAAGMSVDVAFELENGRLVFDGPQMTSSSGGRKATAESIFQVERRAIVMCSENGYDAAYSGTVEMSFGPEGAIALAE